MIRHGAVVYAKDLARVSAFYADVVGLPVIQAAVDHVVHQASDFQLVVHAIPTAIAETIQIQDPPLRREETAVKLVFAVASLDRARTQAAAHGGEIEYAGQRMGMAGLPDP